MFRPNRIGTPNIHTLDDTRSVAAWAPNATILTDQTWLCNVINASPVADFGRSALTWNGAPSAAIANNTLIALGQQLTITEPQAGDTVGLELNGAMLIDLPESIPAIPIFGRLIAASGSVFGGPSGADTFTIIGQADKGPIAVATQSHRSFRYQTQLIMSNSGGLVAGTYFHGLQFINTSGGAWTPTRLRCQFSVRQLNDQQSIGYRDTLR